VTDDRIWILRAGINDDICGTFSSREKAEKQGSFLRSCGELSGYTVTEYAPVSELAEAAKRAEEWQEMHLPAVPRELLVGLLESCARIANRALAEGEDTRG